MLDWIKTAAKAAWSFIGGNSWTLYLAAALAVSVVVGWLAWSRAEYKADLATVKTDLATAQANARTWQDAQNRTKSALDELEADKAKTDAVLATREKAINTIAAERDKLRTRLQEVKNNDPKVRAWADTPVPDAVLGVLREK